MAGLTQKTGQSPTRTAQGSGKLRPGAWRGGWGAGEAKGRTGRASSGCSHWGPRPEGASGAPFRPSHLELTVLLLVHPHFLQGHNLLRLCVPGPI